MEADRIDQSSKMTIGDIAKALGVSKTTVSRAISGKGRIGAETRSKVMEYIEKYNFKPNVMAKGLAQSKTFNIGFVLPGDCNLVDMPYFMKCMVGTSKTASSLDYDVIIVHATSDDSTQLKRIILNNKVDGVILTRTLLDDVTAKYLKSMGVPFVTIGTTDIEGAMQVDNDHREACKELTSILLLKGIRNIALIGGNSTYTVTQNRLKGFMDAFEGMNIPVNHDNIYLNVDTALRSDRAVDEILAKKADCIICMDDLLCMYVLNRLKKLHIKTPDDIKLASFYNSTLLEANNPNISSLQFDAEQIGAAACKMLISGIEGNLKNSHKLLGYDIILKESTK